MYDRRTVQLEPTSGEVHRSPVLFRRSGRYKMIPALSVFRIDACVAVRMLNVDVYMRSAGCLLSRSTKATTRSGQVVVRPATLSRP